MNGPASLTAGGQEQRRAAARLRRGSRQASHDLWQLSRDREEANERSWSKDGQRSHIKCDRVDGWSIDTSFNRFSLAPDGPPLFWRVGCFTEIGPFMRGERCFATKRRRAGISRGPYGHHSKGGGAEELLGLINKAGDGDGEGQDGANWWKEQP